MCPLCEFVLMFIIHIRQITIVSRLLRVHQVDLSADERTLKLMAQHLSLAALPVCSAPPAVAPYPGGKPFSGPLP